MVILRRFPWLQPIAALLALVLFIGGVAALFTLDNSAGSLFLITLGVVLLLVVILDGRMKLESFELLGAKINVQEVVRTRLQLAEATGVVQEDGSDGAVREQARTLQKLVGLYDLFRTVSTAWGSVA